jgi:hypothetical protein
MPQAYPLIEIPDSYNPYANTEPPRLTAPIQGSAGASVTQPAVVAQRSSPTETVPKKKSLLGKIGSVLEAAFMPEPDSLYAAALRGGIWDAKANRQEYLHQQELKDIERSSANKELMDKMNKPQYKVVGNNVLVTPPDGGEAYLMAPPKTPSEFETLSAKWQSLDEGDPLKKLIEGYLLKANAQYVLENKAATARDVAGTRAGATTGAARIRASTPRAGSIGSTQKGVKLPSGAVIIR